MFRDSFEQKLFSPSNVSRDMQKHLFDLSMSQIITILAREIQISFFLATKFPFVQSPPHIDIDGVTLNNFGGLYLTETHAQ